MNSRHRAVARHLPISHSVPLRLRREPGDEIRDEPLPEASDLLSSQDVFPTDGVEADEDDPYDEPVGFLPELPGPVIAAATFIPTFLAVFFGLSHLLGGAAYMGPTASAPVPTAAALMPDPAGQGSAPLSEALRDPFVTPRGFDSPSTRPSVADLPAPAIESTGPTLPPAQPRPAIVPAPAGRAAEPPRQPQAAVLNTTPERTPAADNRKGGREWTPAAAFADREAANRLASSIQQQGYPVEIRQEPSTSRPWVVWIGAQPRGGERRR